MPSAPVSAATRQRARRRVDGDGVDKGKAAVTLRDVHGGMALAHFVQTYSGMRVWARMSPTLAVDAWGMHGIQRCHAEVEDVEDDL